MLIRTTAAMGATAVMTVTLAGAVAAGPWGDVDCEQIPTPSCDVGAGEDDEDEDPGRPPSDPDDPDGDGGGESEEPERPPGDFITGQPDNLSNCAYVPVDYVPPGEDEPPVSVAGPAADRRRETVSVAFASAIVPLEVVPPPSDDEDGAWYVWQCTGEGFTDAAWRPPVWIPNEEQPDGSTGPSVTEVARRAYAQLYLAPPQIALSPADEQLVNLPTWLWLDPADWTEVSATASVPGVSVTAVAAPQSASWSMGDGGTVACAGPGTPFTAGDDPAGKSPDCGYTYPASSAGSPDELFDVTATVEWTVTWSGAGQSGVFPGLTTSSSTDVRVAESHALNTR